MHRFKQSGAAIQSVFKQHLGNDDFAAIAEAATLIADWADVMPDYFPAGSTSPGARDDIWDDFDDFKSKAADNAKAARELHQLALAGTGQRRDCNRRQEDGRHLQSVSSKLPHQEIISNSV